MSTVGSQQGDASSRVAILAALASSPSLSRTELSKKLGFGPATITAQVRRLIKLGYVRELSALSAGTGRPRVPLELVRDASYLIGIALAVDHLVLVATRIDGEILLEERADFDPADESLEQVAVRVETAISRLGASGACVAVGISLSGVVDQATGRVVVSVVMDWRDRDLGEALRTRLGLPVFIENDVHALAARELAFDSHETGDDFILLAIGSGVGMAIVTDSKLFHGLRGGSSEFGHISVDPEGRPCRCGNVGCLQTYAGLGEILEGLSSETDRRVDGIRTVKEHAAAGNEVVLSYLESIGAMLGRAVGGVATLVGIPTVVVTGESVQLWPYLEAAFTSALRDNTRTLLEAPVTLVRDWVEAEGAAGAAGVALSRALMATGEPA